MTGLKLLIFLALLTVAAVPAVVIAKSTAGMDSHGTKSVAVPGPVAGAGLPAIALVGGYIWLVRRRRRDTVRKSAQ